MLAELGKRDITLDQMNIFLEVGNAEAIVKTVEANFGTVVEVPVVGFDLRRQIYMIRPDIHFANRAIEAFWSFVHDLVNADLLRMAER